MQCICDQGNKGTGRTSAVVSMGAPGLLPADSEVDGGAWGSHHER